MTRVSADARLAIFSHREARAAEASAVPSHIPSAGACARGEAPRRDDYSDGLLAGGGGGTSTFFQVLSGL